MKKNTTKRMYENKTVYGDAEKFIQSPDRLQRMIRIVKNLEGKPNHILDIGCGTGYFANEVKKLYPSAFVYGLDISKIAVNKGREIYPEIKLKIANAEVELPFPDNYFDLVISGEHIEHLRDTDTYLMEINRIMKKNGILIITTPNLVSWLNRILVLIGKQPFYSEVSLVKLIPVLTVFNYSFPDITLSPSGHLRLFTAESLRALCEIYQFEQIKVYGVSHLSKPILKQFDRLISTVPTFASGIIAVFEKK